MILILLPAVVTYTEGSWYQNDSFHVKVITLQQMMNNE